VLNSLVKHFQDAHEVDDTLTLVTRKHELPADISRSPAGWDTWAHERLWRHYTTASAVIEPPYSWVFSPSLNQIITPIIGVDGATKGYQARCAPGRKPKAITTFFEGHKGEPLFYKGASTEPLVIVEDPLSALRLHQDRQINAFALLGTHLSDVALTNLVRVVNWYGLGNVRVWMDADEAGKKAAGLIFERVRRLYNVNVTVLNVELPEAKSLKVEQLKGIAI
jgi:hypothetical protein